MWSFVLGIILVLYFALLFEGDEFRNGFEGTLFAIAQLVVTAVLVGLAVAIIVISATYRVPVAFARVVVGAVKRKKSHQE